MPDLGKLENGENSITDATGAGRRFSKYSPRLFFDLVLGLRPTEVKVVAYALEHVSLTDNMLVATHAEIAEELGASPLATTRAIAHLREGGDPFLVKYKVARNLVNPDYFHMGSEAKYIRVRERFRETCDAGGVAHDISFHPRGAGEHFLKVDRIAMAKLYRALAGRQCRVLAWMLANMEATMLDGYNSNCVFATRRQMLDGAVVSAPTLHESMMVLRGRDYPHESGAYDAVGDQYDTASPHGLMGRRAVVMVEDGVYMVNPSLAYRGTQRRYEILSEQFLNVIAAKTYIEYHGWS